MPRRHLRPLVLAAATAVALSCAAVEGHGPGGLATAAPTQTLALEMRDIGFSQARIEAHLNEVVDIEVRNSGALDHDFTIERMSVDTMVPGQQPAAHGAHGPQYAVHGAPGLGQALTIRLHTHEPGEFTYYCSVPGHREAGMTGTLVVS